MPTENRTETRADWPRWAETLRRRGAGNLAAWALEAAGPLALLGAQALHFGGPLLRPTLSGATLDGLVSLLEDEDERRAFVDFLRREEQA